MNLGWLPPSGYGEPSQLIMPVIAVAAGMGASVTRLTRSSMLDVMRQDYITTARAKGAKENTVIVKHGLHNALLTVVTFVALQIGYMFAGSVVVESVFALPGLGRLIVTAIKDYDFPLIQASTLAFAPHFLADQLHCRYLLHVDRSENILQKQRRRGMNDVWKMIRHSTRTAKFALVVVAVWIVVAVLAPILAPYGMNDIDVAQRLAPPCWMEGGSMDHIFGTDQLGRDVLTRLIYGSRISLIVGIVAGIVGLVIGVILGLLAGYFGGWIDVVISRMIDVMLAFPFIFLALLLVAALGASLTNVILVLGITGWVPYARTVRAQVLSVKEKEFVKAAHALGCSDGRIIFKQILPSVIDSAIILGTMDIGTIILSEASLTFLGLGIPPNIATWGNMIANGNDYIFSAGWLTMIPGIALLIGCISINFVGDWLRDVRDPRLRGVD